MRTLAPTTSTAFGKPFSASVPHIYEVEMMTVFCVNCYRHCFRCHHFIGLFIHSQLLIAHWETEAQNNTNCLMSSSRAQQKQDLQLLNFALCTTLIYNLGTTRWKSTCCLSSTFRQGDTCLLVLTLLFAAYLVVAVFPAEKVQYLICKNHTVREDTVIANAGLWSRCRF